MPFKVDILLEGFDEGLLWWTSFSLTLTFGLFFVVSV